MMTTKLRFHIDTFFQNTEQPGEIIVPLYNDKNDDLRSKGIIVASYLNAFLFSYLRG